jgi:hypothetical protein
MIYKNYSNASCLNFYFFLLLLLLQTSAWAQSVVAVHGLDGRFLKYPFAGGLNNPQFSNIDIDQDGKLDLFIFDKSDRSVLLFQNTSLPGNSEAAYLWQPAWSAFFPLEDLEDWALLRDFNCDSAIDLFTGNNSQVKVFRNVARPGESPKFELYQNSLRCRYLEEESWVYVAGSDIPGIADIDQDGDLDIISWDVTGSWVNAYKNLAQELYNRCDTLAMAHTSSCWGNFQEFYNADSNYYDVKLGLEPCAHNNKISHIGGVLLPIQLNGDSLIDLLISDTGLPEAIALFNNGTRAIARMSQKEIQFPQNSKKIDIDFFPGLFSVKIGADTVSSLIAAPNQTDFFEDKAAIWLYANKGTEKQPVFLFQDSAFLQQETLDFGSGALPAIGDLNGDGRPDILISAAETYLGNNGLAATLNVALQKAATEDSLVFYIFRENFLDLSRAGLTYLSPALGDLDGDGDNDLLLGTALGEVYYYENIAPKGQFANFLLRDRNYLKKSPNEPLAAPSPTLFDLDSDGDLDLLIGTARGAIWLYENLGTRRQPNFIKRTERWGQISVTDWDNTQLGRARPLLKDFNQDGAPDLIIGNASGFLLYASAVCLEPQGKLRLDTLQTNFKTQNIAPAFLQDRNISAFILGSQRGGLLFIPSPPLSDNSDINVCPRHTTKPPKWSVYPNPARNTLTLNAYEGAKIGWYNTLGQLLHITEIESNTETEIALPIHHLPSGVYILKNIDEKSNLYKKIIITSP